MENNRKMSHKELSDSFLRMMENLPLSTIKREQWNTNPIVLPNKDEQWSGTLLFSSHMELIISNTTIKVV